MYAIRSYYGDFSEDQTTLFETHIKELCGAYREAFAPFLSRCLIKLSGKTLHVDFADDFTPRITSYNVCYTKLLRVSLRGIENADTTRVIRQRRLDDHSVV